MMISNLLKIWFMGLFIVANLSVTAVKAGSNAEEAVTKENYAMAMFDMAMVRGGGESEANNKWHHHKTLMKLDAQPAPMMNRDTVYSFAVLDARGDIEITLPESDGRYMSLQIVNHNHVTYKVFYGSGTYRIPASGTSDFIVANVRMQVSSTDPEDVKKANALQDQLQVKHLNGYQPESYQGTNWNMNDFKKIHKHYVEVANKEGIQGTMGTVEQPVSTEDRNRGVSIAAGLLPDEDAIYLTAKYSFDKGTAVKATYEIPELADPKLGFYSLTIYGDDQFLHTDKGSTINNQEIKLNPDGKSFDIYYTREDNFGTYDNELLIPTDEFWITFRIYMPGETVAKQGYDLPIPKPVK